MPPRTLKKKAAGKRGSSTWLLLGLVLLTGAGAYLFRSFITGGAPADAGASTGAEEQAAAADSQPVHEAELTPEQHAARFVADLIKQNRVMIFSKSYCPFSMRGKDMMRRHAGDQFVHVVELDRLEAGEPEMGLVQDELARVTGARTVPRIFVDGSFLGGADDVSAKEQSGELAALLQAKGLLAQA